MKTWLKGGLIGLVISLLILVMGCIFIGGSNSCLFIVAYASFPVGIIADAFNSFPLMIALFVIEYFILGSLVGLIISKIKGNKQKSLDNTQNGV